MVLRKKSGMLGVVEHNAKKLYASLNRLSQLALSDAKFKVNIILFQKF